MSQRVPSWDLDDGGPILSNKPSLGSHPNSTQTDVPKMNYEVAELTWENGQLAMHGLGPPRGFPYSKIATTTAPAPTNAGTLESLVNQATFATDPTNPHRRPRPGSAEDDELVPWFDHSRRPPTVTMDALVPCSTRVGSCSEGPKRARARGECGVSGRDTDRESHHVALDTCERRGGGGFTSTSFGGSRTQTQDNTSYGRPTCTTGKTVTVDENDSVGHSRPSGETGDDDEEEELQLKKGNGKSSGLTKRSRAAAIHNQSEQKRRDKINQRMKTLQKLVPNSSKTDKASMLDEVIDYLKQLQAQVQMMGRINMHPMMLPMAMQQQLQMSMMTPMSMGMGMAMGMGMGVMDMNSMARHNIPGISPVIHPSAFMPLASWDGSGGGDWLSAASAGVMPDPMSAFLASQPMTMDAYSRMAAMYQQLSQQPPASTSKN